MTARRSTTIAVIIPCHNEEAGIARVITEFPFAALRKQGYEAEILVIDNASTDRTALIARSLGATVINEPRKGKGVAVRTGFRNLPVAAKYVVMLDGDNTYKAYEIPRLIEPLANGFCDVIIGSRLGGKTRAGSLRYRNRIVNWVFAFLVRQLYRANVTDVLSGFVAWKRDAADELASHLASKGFSIEVEMIAKAVRLGHEIYSVPITYDVREGETKISAVADGIRILAALVRNFFWRPSAPKAAPFTLPAPTRIAIVSDAVYPFNKGGKERRIYEISRRLAASGKQVTIYCMQWWQGERTMTRNGVTYHAISPYYPLYAGERRSIKQALFFALHCLKLLREKFDVIEIDAIPVVPLLTTKFVCLLKRKKMVVSWHEVWGAEYWRYYLGFAGIVAYWTERLFARLPNTIISVSDHTTRALRTSLGARAEIRTIPNGVDLTAIRRNAPGPLTSDIIYAGRLLAHKNVDTLIRAMAIARKQSPDLRLFIVGDGPERPRLEELMHSLGIADNVRFFGFLDDEDELFSMMLSSKVFVLPSTREGYGIAVLEANACGLPVIAIDHAENAARDLIIPNENGVLCSLDSERLAYAITMMLRDRRPAEEYRHYAERHNWDERVREIRQAYAI